MAFGKPASWISVIVFAVCWIWCIIGLAVSASYGWLSSGGYGLGVTGGVLGFLVTPVMVLWLMWTNLNEWDPAWIIFLIVLCLATLFLLIAGIIFATISVGVPAALDIVAAITLGVGIFFWIRSRGAVPQSNASREETSEYQEW